MNLHIIWNKFYEKIEKDPRIGSTHISLYMALLHICFSKGENPVQFKRQEVMRNAKINARHTFNRCINDLSLYGYISYRPSKNRYCKSQVSLCHFELETKT